MTSQDGHVRKVTKSALTRITLAFLSSGLEGQGLRQRVVSRVGTNPVACVRPTN